MDFQARHPLAGTLVVRLTVQSGPQLQSLEQPINLEAVPGELAPTLRSDGSTVNPDCFQYVNFVDLGSL